MGRQGIMGGVGKAGGNENRTKPKTIANEGLDNSEVAWVWRTRRNHLNMSPILETAK